MLLCSLRTMQLLCIIFVLMFLVLLKGLPHERNLFAASPHLLEGILKYSRALYGDVLVYSWELFPILSYEIFYILFLYYWDSQCAKKIFTFRIPLLGALCIISGPILVVFLHALKNLKHFVWMFSYYCGSY